MHPHRRLPNIAICIASLCGLASLVACTTLEPSLLPEPLVGYDLVDPSLIDSVKYQRDYQQCAELANQNLSDVTRVASRALSTAADKASLGIIGLRVSKDADRRTVLKRCLAGRGYVILR
jgi:hypothetical protein